MNQSPRGISPTESRIDYLMKAKSLREKKNGERRDTSATVNEIGYLTPFTRRNMTIDHGKDSTVSGAFT